MKCTRVWALIGALLVSAGAPTVGFAESILYATGIKPATDPGQNPGALFTIDTSTGAATKLFDLGFWAHQGGLAYDSASDQLYATGYDATGQSGLWTINRYTRTSSFIGYTAPGASSGGLDFGSNGVLYATANNPGSSFHSINPATGAATLIANAPNSTWNLNGIGFGPGGTLYANGSYWNGTGFDGALFTINTVTGAMTFVGNHGVYIPGTDPRALGYSDLAYGEDGFMYSLGSVSSSQSGLYRVNLQTGAGTLVGNTGVQFGALGGLQFVPTRTSTAVPEPATLMLLSTALLGFALRRRSLR